MGLGKTLQSLALICHARRAPTRRPRRSWSSRRPAWWQLGGRGRAVRPGPERRAGHRAPQRRRGQDLDELVAGADVVVTSYTLLRLDFDAYAALTWAGLILDEAQYVKNHQSKTYQCARRLDAPFKLAITGTPMENNLMELWSLLSITAPGLFPEPGPVPRVLRAGRSSDRATGRAAGPAPAPDPAAGPAAHQGAGGRRPARQAGAGARGRAASAAPQGSTRPTCSGSGRRCSA